MKQNIFVMSVIKALKDNKIREEDVLQLYKDNYLTELECLQVLEGGKNGRVYNKLSNLR